MFAVLDKMITIGHNSCKYCNAHNSCTGHNVYCFIEHYIMAEILFTDIINAITITIVMAIIAVVPVIWLENDHS